LVAQALTYPAGGEAAEGGVGPIGVVLAPGPNEYLGLEKVPELFVAQQLVPLRPLTLSMNRLSDGEPGSMQAARRRLAAANAIRFPGKPVPPRLPEAAKDQ
jgi:hypothetical protein